MKSPTPLKAIRKYCLWDMQGSYKEIERCPELEADCPFLPFRFGEETQENNPLMAIRLVCLHCVGGRWKDIFDCEDKDCSLYSFRPKRKSLQIAKQFENLLREWGNSEEIIESMRRQ